VTFWEPGERLAHSFVMAQDARHPSQVTVDFVNDGAGTRVKFAHGAWSDANVDARAKFTEWPVILDRFAALAESRD
jgi:hypothetical protein